MSIAGIIFLIVTTLLVIAVIVGLPRDIIRNSLNGIMHREKVLERIGKLRLHKMLAALGIDENQYVYNTRLTDIETHMHRCSDCGAKQECDRQLASENVSGADRFCPNNEELVRHQHT